MRKKPGKVLIVDDEKDIRDLLSRVLDREGLPSLTAEDGRDALRTIQMESPEAVMLDLRLPDMDGLEVLRRVRQMDEDLPVIVITAHPGISGAVDAMRSSAHDYLAKPFDNNDVVRTVRRALSEYQLKCRLKGNASRTGVRQNLAEQMGPSEAVGRLIADVNCVAKSDFSVVIIGETGAGKELVANSVHQAGSRSNGPFVAVDCGAIPDTLLESELFGHEKGAFTGAVRQTSGRFMAAHGGTLFLDEVENMPLSAQVKLLRVIQEKTVNRVGGSSPVKVDVRIITASNRDLEELVQAGSFRNDLFFRLSEFSIKIPPLRERKEDILYLAQRFLSGANEELNKTIRGFSNAAKSGLLAYSWPGNVRQLRSMVRRAALLADDWIDETLLDMPPTESGIPTSVPFMADVDLKIDKGFSLKEIIHESTDQVEREVISRVLEKTKGNKAMAARVLHVDYKTIHSKIKKYSIQNQTLRKTS